MRTREVTRDQCRTRKTVGLFHLERVLPRTIILGRALKSRHWHLVQHRSFWAHCCPRMRRSICSILAFAGVAHGPDQTSYVGHRCCTAARETGLSLRPQDRGGVKFTLCGTKRPLLPLETQSDSNDYEGCSSDWGASSQISYQAGFSETNS